MNMLLIKRAQKHDTDAFIQLIEEYKTALYKVAKTYLKNEEDVADVIQGTILSAYEHIGELKTVSYFKTWLIRELPEKDRTIFLLYYGECFNAREIAELLGWNENTVKSRLQRGRKKLKQVLSC